MTLAKWVFRLAGIYGVLALVPMYFAESQVAADKPLNFPEFYYGFLGVALAWQVLFLVIATDPIRFRPAMLPAMLEKASFAIAVPILFALGRVSPGMLAPSLVDGVWLVLFGIAFARTPRQRQ
jgi:hypothetical protein